uniref:Ig-like domain-containing protein n=1 Tax=Mola mola TaxID=94237 RepID=A0A3Q3XP28_MOLML
LWALLSLTWAGRYIDILGFAEKSPIYSLKGQQVRLKPSFTGEADEILWKHNGNKAIEFSGNEELVYGTFKNRVTLDWHSAQLNITDLRFEDSGDYDLEVVIKQMLYEYNYKLEVIEKVPKPTIICELSNGSSSNKLGLLMCSAEPKHYHSIVKYGWILNGTVWHGPKLKIPLGDEPKESYSVRCWVSNTLSNESATFNTKDCYAGKISLKNQLRCT